MQGFDKPLTKLIAGGSSEPDWEDDCNAPVISSIEDVCQLRADSLMEEAPVPQLNTCCFDGGVPKQMYSKTTTWYCLFHGTREYITTYYGEHNEELCGC